MVKLTPREVRGALVKGEASIEEHGKPEAIIEAAKELFTTVGYEATTIAEVARKAGVAVGTVYLYFKNKADLLEAVRGDWESQFLEYIELPEIQALPHHLRARPLIEKSFAICEEHREMVQLMAIQPEQMGNWGAVHTGRIWQALQAIFEEGIEAGALRPVDPRAAAVIAYGMVNQALVQCFLIEGGGNKRRYIDAIVDALQEWLLSPAGVASSHS